jgi:hypothetical protein
MTSMLFLPASWRRWLALVPAAFVPGLAAAQGQGSWGGARDLVLAALWIAAIGLLLWVCLVWWVAKKMGARGPVLVLATALVGSLPVAMVLVPTRGFNEGIADLQQVQGEVRAKAEAYVAANCASERRASAPMSLPAGAGVFLKTNGDVPPDIQDIPAAAPPSEQTKLQLERYGYSYPHATNEAQFRKPLYWTAHVFTDSVHATGLAFVEFEDSRGRYRRRASLQWWRQNAPPAELQQLLQAGGYGDGSHLDPKSGLEFPVHELRSVHDLVFRDVSTRQDREHWAARGRIRLVRRSDQAIVAEYVGLAAAQQIVSAGYDHWWQRVTVCAGPEASYMAAEGRRWEPERFFFREIVRLEAVPPPAR